MMDCDLESVEENKEDIIVTPTLEAKKSPSTRMDQRTEGSEIKIEKFSLRKISSRNKKEFEDLNSFF